MYSRRTFHLDESEQEISIHEEDVSLITVCLVTALSWQYKNKNMFLCFVGGRNVNTLFTPILVAE